MTTYETLVEVAVYEYETAIADATARKWAGTPASPDARGSRADHLQRILRDLKLSVGCADCGYREHPAALEFDHVRGEKRFNLAKVRHHTPAPTALRKELLKCEVVCSNCHHVRTATRYTVAVG